MVRTYVEYWSRVEKQSPKELLSGLAHSILCVLDGVAGTFPTVDMVISPHPDDKKFHQDEGENWYADAPKEASEAAFNDTMLHELLYQGWKP